MSSNAAMKCEVKSKLAKPEIPQGWSSISRENHPNGYFVLYTAPPAGTNCEPAQVGELKSGSWMEITAGFANRETENTASFHF